MVDTIEIETRHGPVELSYNYIAGHGGQVTSGDETVTTKFDDIAIEHVSMGTGRNVLAWFRYEDSLVTSIVMPGSEALKLKEVFVGVDDIEFTDRREMIA